MRTLGLAAATVAVVLAVAGLAYVNLKPGISSAAPAPLQMRRMTESQYRNTISDVFSPDIRVVGRFEPDLRVEGLAAVGSSQVSISASGYEQYYGLAGRIAGQLLDDQQWRSIMPCDSETPTSYNEACAQQIITHFGERLFRREMTPESVDEWLVAGRLAMEHVGDFRSAMALTIEGMLSSPEFLFIVDTVEDTEDGRARLTGHAMASRLSYLLWNTVPDEELLHAARTGELATRAGLEAQVDRMLASERLQEGVEAFFSDFLHLNAFATLDKDKLIYPAFNQEVAADAREQLVMFMNYHLLEREAPYTEVLTSKETFMTRPLGVIYGVPVRPRNDWELVRFEDEDLRGGLISHIGFTALHSHPGRSSATLRGIAVRELLLCQSVAPAPAAVNFTVVQETDNPDFKTARARLTQHRTDDACASCHEFIDPIGLAMENFDGSGSLRFAENGEHIDASGVIDGYHFGDINSLGRVLSEHPATTACLVEKMQRYAAGRSVRQSESAWTDRLERSFKAKDYRLKPLLREIALSPELYAVSVPGAVPDIQKASRQEPENQT
ncbi:MAG: DUF1592 domain-containing protein [Hyphomonas sp.]